MKHFDVNRASIQSLQQALGESLGAAIEKQGGKVDFTKRAGLNRTTLYRLLRGENVSTEVLLRALRALGRADLVAALVAPPEPSPLELRPAVTNRRQRTRRAPPVRAAVSDTAGPPSLHDVAAPNPEPSSQTPNALPNPKPVRKARSLVNQLVLGRLAKESDDA